MPRDYIYEDGALMEGPDEPQQGELQARDLCEELGRPIYYVAGRLFLWAERVSPPSLAGVFGGSSGVLGFITGGGPSPTLYRTHEQAKANAGGGAVFALQEVQDDQEGRDGR